MFGSLTVQQWQERVRFSTTRQITYLLQTIDHPAYALARLRNADLHADLTAICRAELARRAQPTATLADIVPPMDMDLTRTTRN